MRGSTEHSRSSTVLGFFRAPAEIRCHRTTASNGKVARTAQHPDDSLGVPCLSRQRIDNGCNGRHHPDGLYCFAPRMIKLGWTTTTTTATTTTTPAATTTTTPAATTTTTRTRTRTIIIITITRFVVIVIYAVYIIICINMYIYMTLYICIHIIH